MNYKLVFKTIGKLLQVEAALLVFPLIFSLFYKEKISYSFLIPIAILLLVSRGLSFLKPKETKFYAKDGFATVGISWIIFSIFGALPFILSNTLPNFFDAFFEAASGFTTTGSTVITDIEIVPKSIQLWRSLTNWVGGMGILVFIIAIIPQTNSRSIYLLKAESTGMKVGKLTSKITLSARILYLIYIGLTLLLLILLSLKIPFFDSLNYALSSAGTGGFAIHNTSIAYYSSAYVEIVIAIFITIFGINFNIFYLIIIGNIKQALKSEELRYYLLILFGATILIALNTLSIYTNFTSALRFSYFQSASIMTTTGFSSVDFNTWSNFSKWILIILMVIGGSAGSTAGGIKVSRIMIYFKTIIKEIKHTINPNHISIITFEEKKIEESTSKGVFAYLSAYLFILVIAALLISIDGHDIVTNFTASLSSISNIGPGLSMVGPLGNYSIFSNFSKIILSIVMLTGRLELFPILILFSPSLYKNN
ncbi:MAG: TrkH family potassium uptake protein [Bacilli bacterium]|nr:TrkH family potassium uptake protein [Bacilli bacterium]